MINRLFLFLIFGFSFTVLSCNETGNEPNESTNTHNTSQSSSAANTENIQVDARSKIPANRLNDGNLDTRSSNRSNIPEGYSTGETAGATTTPDRWDQSVDVDENQQGQDSDTTNNKMENQQGQASDTADNEMENQEGAID